MAKENKQMVTSTRIIIPFISIKRIFIFNSWALMIIILQKKFKIKAFSKEKNHYFHYKEKKNLDNLGGKFKLFARSTSFSWESIKNVKNPNNIYRQKMKQFKNFCSVQLPCPMFAFRSTGLFFSFLFFWFLVLILSLPEKYNTVIIYCS